MKYIVILGDGMADYPIKELNNKTPLQYAYKPNMDRLAEKSEIGLVKTIPDGFPPGSDVANLSVMGYDPKRFYTGRSPLEAVSLGVQLGELDVAFRCNLVTLSDEKRYNQKTMIDYSSQEITTEESQELMKSVNKKLGSDKFHFYPGISYRHLMVWINGLADLNLIPPHDITDKKIENYLPQGEGSALLLNIMEESAGILSNHPVNEFRKARGLRPATSIWLWGQGKKPSLSSFYQEFGVKGSVVSAVDLVKGIGICAGLDVVNVPGATGNIHTNYQGKAEAVLKELIKGKDYVYLHIEAPDEAGHQGNLKDKVKAIEEIDDKVLGTILRGMDSINDDYRIMILPDHPTPLSIKTHTAEAVPFMICDSRFSHSSSQRSYDEKSAQNSGVYVENGFQLMCRFLKGWI